MIIMDTNQWLALALVLGTAIAILLLGIEIGRSLGPRRGELEDGGQLDDGPRPVPYLVTRRGWVDFVPYGPPRFQGAADPGAFEARRPGQPGDLMDLLDDALGIAERQMTARQVAAEVRAIEAEVDAHPEWWRTR